MEINGENYCVTYDPKTATVTCQGALRLYGSAGYMAIVDLFNQVADQRPAQIILNLEGLQFLNSSGINAFSKFVIKVRNLKTSQLIVKGTNEFSWQSKSLVNLQRLMPEIRLELE
jgi:hypothetical protein